MKDKPDYDGLRFKTIKRLFRFFKEFFKDSNIVHLQNPKHFGIVIQ